MKKSLFVFISLLFSAQLSLAASQQQLDSAEQLLDMLDMDSAMQGSVEQMLNIQIQQNPAMGQFKDIMMEFLSKHLSYDAIKSDMVAIYAEAFSHDELQDLIAFYKTPTGEKSMELLPQLMAQGAQLGQQRVRQNSHELQKMIMEKLAADQPAE
ncbi:MAG: DUF2059 domain-containing protein [Porticoccaceae bacterium]|nr:DUF2059 domain-containing protein [Porticoccaceae bacterium]